MKYAIEQLEEAVSGCMRARHSRFIHGPHQRERIRSYVKALRVLRACDGRDLVLVPREEWESLRMSEDELFTQKLYCDLERMKAKRT